MRKLIFLFLLLFPLLANAQIVVRHRPLHVPASGGIAFGASTRGDNTSASSLTFDSPSVSGSNTLATVVVTTRGPQVVSGVTWNGVSMSENASSFNNTSGSFRLHIFYLVAPAAGVTSVVVSAGGSWGGIYADASYYTGVNQSTPIDTGGSGDAGAIVASYSPTATTNNANEYVLAQAVLPNACSIPAAASPAVSTQAGCDGTMSWRSVYMPVASASTPTFEWTVGTANNWFWSWMSIRPA